MSMNTVVLAGVVASDPTWVEIGGQPGAKVALTVWEKRPVKGEQGAFEQVPMTFWVATTRQDASDVIMAMQRDQALVVRGHLEERKVKDGAREWTRLVVIADEASTTMAVAFMKGRLGRDPEPKGESGGIVELRLASDHYRPGLSGGKGEQIPVWVSCVSFFKGANAFLTKHFKKGSDIVVMGALSEESFSREDGSKGVRTQVKILERDFGSGARGQGQGQGAGGSYPNMDEDPFGPEDFGPGPRGGATRPPRPSASGDLDFGDDDIPF